MTSRNSSAWLGGIANVASSGFGAAQAQRKSSNEYETNPRTLEQHENQERLHKTNQFDGNNVNPQNHDNFALSQELKPSAGKEQAALAAQSRPPESEDEKISSNSLGHRIRNIIVAPWVNPLNDIVNDCKRSISDTVQMEICVCLRDYENSQDPSQKNSWKDVASLCAVIRKHYPGDDWAFSLELLSRVLLYFTAAYRYHIPSGRVTEPQKLDPNLCYMLNELLQFSNPTIDSLKLRDVAIATTAANQLPNAKLQGLSEALDLLFASNQNRSNAIGRSRFDLLTAFIPQFRQFALYGLIVSLACRRRLVQSRSLIEFSCLVDQIVLLPLFEYGYVEWIELSDVAYVCDGIEKVRSYEPVRQRVPFPEVNNQPFFELLDRLERRLVPHDLENALRIPAIIDTYLAFLQYVSPLIPINMHTTVLLLQRILESLDESSVSVFCSRVLGMLKAIDNLDSEHPKVLSKKFMELLVQRVTSLPIDNFRFVKFRLCLLLLENIPGNAYRKAISTRLLSLVESDSRHREALLTTMNVDELLRLKFQYTASSDKEVLLFVQDFISRNVTLATKSCLAGNLSMIGKLDEMTHLITEFSTHDLVLPNFISENEINWDAVLTLPTTMFQSVVSASANVLNPGGPSSNDRDEDVAIVTRLLLRVLEVILNCDDFNSKIDEALDDVRLSSNKHERYDEFQQKFLKCNLRRLFTGPLCAQLISKMEQNYLERHPVASFPTLYSFVCRSVVESLSNNSSSQESISHYCQFISQDACLSNAACFTVNSINLQLTAGAVCEVARLICETPFSLPPPVIELHGLSWLLRGYSNSNSLCLELHREVVNETQVKLGDVMESLRAANASIAPLARLLLDEVVGLDSLLRSIKNCALTKNHVNVLQQNLDSTAAVWKKFECHGLNGVTLATISSVTGMFSTAMDSLAEYERVHRWLTSKGLTSNSTAKAVLENFTVPPEEIALEVILERIRRVRRFWRVSESDDSPEFKWMNTLRYFVGRSNLFDSYFSQQAEKWLSSESSGNVNLENLVDQTVVALKNIIDDGDLRLSKLAKGDISGMMKALRGSRRDIVKELSVIAKYFHSEFRGDDKKSAEEITGERMRRLNAAVDLLELSDVLPGTVHFLELNRVLPANKQNTWIISTMKDFCRNVSAVGLESIYLKNVEETLSQARVLTQYLDCAHLRILNSLRDGHFLFDFLQSEPGISDQIAILTQEMYGNSVNQKILTDLSQALEFLKEFFPALVQKYAQPTYDYADIARKLIEKKYNQNAVRELVAAIQSCVLHASELITWFGGAFGGINADKIVAIVTRYQNEGGVFFVRTAGCENGPTLGLKQKIESSFEVSGVRLLEQVRAAVFVCGDDGANTSGLNDTQRQSLKEFKLAHKVAMDVFKEVIHAESIGIPEFENKGIVLLGNSIDVDMLKRVHAEVKNRIQQWEAKIDEASSKCPRIALLDTPQFLCLMNLVAPTKELIENQKNNDSNSKDNAIPIIAVSTNNVMICGQLLICFPDASSQEPESPFSFVQQAILDSLNVWFGAKSFVEAGGGDIDRLGCVLSVVASVENSLCEKGIVDPMDFDIKGIPQVLCCIDFSNRRLISSLEHSWAAIPSPSQLFWCSKYTTALQLRRFLGAAKSLSGLKFAIIGISSLSFVLREQLLQWLTSDGPLKTGQNLWLVFTKQFGMDDFTVFPRITPEETLFNVKKALHTYGAIHCFSRIRAVTGRAGAGKTVYIREQMFKEDAISPQLVFMLTVHEDFMPSIFMNWYEENVVMKESCPETVGIILNITPYGSRTAFARFLYSLFCWGMMIDEATGKIVTISSRVRHIISIEFPDLDEWDGSQHPYVDEIAILKSLNLTWIEVNYSTSPLIIDANVRLLAYYLKLYYSNAMFVKPFRLFPKLPFEVIEGEEAEPTPVSEDCGRFVGYISNEECIKLVERLFSCSFFTSAIPAAGPWNGPLNAPCESVPPLHAHRTTCLRLLAERVRFFPFMQARFAYEESNPATRSTLYHDCSNSSSAMGSLMTLFLEESTVISNGTLLQDWSKVEKPFTARYCSEKKITRTSLNILCISAESENDVRLATNQSHCGFDGRRLRTTPGLLRVAFSYGFGIYDTSKVASILRGTGYVLTTDFATKLLVLFEKMKVNVPTILQGETGTGKTELLATLANLANSDDRLYPDLFKILRVALRTLVERDVFRYTCSAHLKMFAVSKGNIKTYVCQLAALNGEMIQRVARVGELWPAEESSQLLNGLQVALEDDERTIDAAPLLLRMFRRCFRAHPLLYRSKLVSTVFMKDVLLRARKEKTGKARGGAKDDEDSDVEEADVANMKELAAGLYKNKNFDPENLPFSSAIEDSRALSQFIFEAIRSGPKELFQRIRMHEGITPKEFRIKIRDIAGKARDSERRICRAGGPVPKMIGFIDELNTTSNMGMVKEVFLDHTLDGQPLPRNIFWVGAINPYSKVSSNPDDVVDDRSTRAQRYIVNPLPKSLEATVMHYSSLTSDQEKEWIHNYLADAVLGATTAKNFHIINPILRNTIAMSQEFVRNARMERVEVSIRDMVRVMRLYSFFLEKKYSSLFMWGNQLPADEGSVEMCIVAVLLALGLTYYLRLEASPTRNLRIEYEIQLHKELLATTTQLGGGNVPTNVCERFPFKEILYRAVDNLWDVTKRPRGIAPTRGIKENLFATVVCIEACVPLIITGPPGAGKTLSFQIAVRNMKGESSVSEEYRRFKLVQLFSYQCSEQSTASEIQDVYENAQRRQERSETARCVVFLDEAGLPRERRAALKSIHYYTDHAKVASVMLTNQTLDAAKNNRAVQLLQAEATTDDLFALAFGSVVLNEDEFAKTDVFDNLNKLVTMNQKFQVEGLCRAFATISQSDYLGLYSDINGHPNVFQLRDFIFLCRFLRFTRWSLLNNYDADVNLTDRLFDANHLVRALRRTFNGPSKSCFCALTKLFLYETGLLEEAVAFAVAKFPELEKDSALSKFLDSQAIPSLKEALVDQLTENEDPNQSHFRHIMIIDESTSENAINSLFETKILNPLNVEVFQVSDFAEDSTDINRSALISRIKTAVEMGTTIVLVNGQSIFTAFFDLVNKNYIPISCSSGSEVTGEGAQDSFYENGSRQRQNFYANISMGSFSRPCMVDRNTKIIVHVPWHKLPDTPLPFLNRFDKFRITLYDLLMDQLESIKPPVNFSRNMDEDVTLSQTYRYIFAGVEEFASTFKSQLYGVVPRETVAALMLRSLQDTMNAKSSDPIVRRALHVASHGDQMEAEAFIESENAKTDDFSASANSKTLNFQKKLKRFIRLFNYQLLQLARPEHLFLQLNVLDRGYLKEYMAQEHFSAANLIQNLVCLHWNRPLHLEKEGDQFAYRGNKLMIFVRTSSELLKVRSSKELRDRLRLCNCDADSLQVLQIGLFESAESCIKRLEEFIGERSGEAGHRRLLLVIADRSVAKKGRQSVFTGQVNMIVRFVDQTLSSYSNPTQQPLVIIVQHFPSESLTHSVVYDSIPFNGWDMNYCDSFGLEELQIGNDKQFGAVVNDDGGVDDEEEKKDSQAEAVISLEGVSDPRKWMRVAFGLAKNPDPSNAVVEFLNPFLEEATKVLSSVSVGTLTGKVTNMSRLNVLRKTMSFYSRIKSGGGQFRGLLEERRYLLRRLLSKFTDAWAEALRENIEWAVQDVVSGQSLDSLLGKMRQSFQSLIRNFARFALQQFCSNYQLEAIAELPTENSIKEVIPEDKRAFYRLAELLIDCMAIPTADYLSQLGDEDFLSLSFDCEVPPLLPFYFELIRHLNNYQFAAVMKAQKDVQDQLEIMRELVAENAKLKEACDIINSNGKAWEAWIHDLVMISYSLDNIDHRDLVAIGVAIDVFCDNSRDVVRAFHDPNLREVVLQVVAVTLPVQSMYPRGTQPNLFDDLKKFAVGISSSVERSRNLFKALNDCVIEIALNEWERLIQPSSVLSDNWVALIRQINVNFPNWRNALIIEFPETVAWFKTIQYLISGGCPDDVTMELLRDVFSQQRRPIEQIEGASMLRDISIQVVKIVQRITDMNDELKQSVIITVVVPLISWFEGNKFEYFSWRNLEFLLSCLGTDRRNIVGNFPILIQIRWLCSILTSKEDIQPSARRILNVELLQRNCGVEPLFSPELCRASRQLLSQRGAHQLVLSLEVRESGKSLCELVWVATLECIRGEHAELDLNKLLEWFEERNRVRRNISSGSASEQQQAVLLNIETSAIAVRVVEVASMLWKKDESGRQIVCSFLKGLRQLFDQCDGLREYFLTTLKCEAAETFLSDRGRINELGIDPSWFIPPVDSAVSREQLYGRMPFMVQEDNELFSDYAAIQRIVQRETEFVQREVVNKLTQWTDTLERRPEMVCCMRMLLFLAVYHERFVHGLACPSILAWLRLDGQNCMRLQLDELTVRPFEKLGRGPVEHGVDADGVSYFFSIESMQDRSEFMVTKRTSFVNAMALMLGTEFSKSYFAMVCFGSVKTSFGLGSGYGTVSKDCGYQVNIDDEGKPTFADHGFAERGVAPYRGIRKFRALNNYLIWAAYAWGHWLRTETPGDFDYAITHREHVVGKNSLTQESTCQFSPRQIIAFNMSQRANTFLEFLSSDESFENNDVNPHLFVTFAIYRTMMECRNSNVPKNFFPSTESYQNLYSTMNFYIDRCWQPAFNDTPGLGRVFLRQKNFHASKRTIKQAGAVMSELLFFRKFPNDNLVATALSVQSSVGTAVQQSAAKFINRLQQQEEMYSMGKHMSLLVKVSHWVHQNLVYRFSAKNSYRLTAWEAFADPENSDELSYGQRLLLEFEAAWNQMKDVFLTYMDCAHAQAHGESEIPALDVRSSDFTLNFMLYLSPEEPDLCSRMLEARLFRLQNDLLGDIDLLRSLSSTEPFSINRHSCLLDMQCLSVLHQLSANSVLHIPKSRELKDLIQTHSKLQKCEATGEEEAVVDILAVTRCIVTKFISGLPQRELSGIALPYKARMEKETKTQSRDITDLKSCHYQPYEPMSHALDEFRRKIRGSVADLLVKEMSENEFAKINNALKRAGEEIGSDLFKYLHLLLIQLNGNVPENEAEAIKWLNQPIGGIDINVNALKCPCAQSLVASIRQCSVKSIVHVCKIIMNWWAAQEFLFSSDVGPDFSVEMDEVLMAQLTLLEEEAMMENGNWDSSILEIRLSNHLSLLKATVNILCQEEVRNGLISKNPMALLSTVVASRLNALRGFRFGLEESVHAFLTSSEKGQGLRCCHYAHCLRKLRELCGALSLRHALVSTDVHAFVGPKRMYVELLPREPDAKSWTSVDSPTKKKTSESNLTARESEASDVKDAEKKHSKLKHAPAEIASLVHLLSEEDPVTSTTALLTLRNLAGNASCLRQILGEDLTRWPILGMEFRDRARKMFPQTSVVADVCVMPKPDLMTYFNGVGSSALSLDEALCRIKSHLPNVLGAMIRENLDNKLDEISNIAWSMLMNDSDRDENGLSRDEIAALMLYSANLRVPPQFFSVLNQRLRDREHLDVFMPYIRILLNGLKKCPVYQNEMVYRAIRVKGQDLKDLLSAYPENEPLRWYSFASTSVKVHTQELFLDEEVIIDAHGDGHWLKTGVMFHIRLLPGFSRIIRRYSMFPTEDEVLLPPNFKFQVVSKFSSSPNLHILQLEELPNDQPVIDLSSR